MKSESKSALYFENLDGLRFISFLSVFFFHSFHTTNDDIKYSGIYQFVKVDVFGNGNLGVNFFFVLSGFLITFLLLEEKKRFAFIDVRRFWMRRILRIWPLFYCCIVFGFLAFPILKNIFGEDSTETARWPFYVLFINNFDFIRNGPPDASVLGVLWSIAVEEQFYLLWPVILFFFPVGRLQYVFTTLLVGSVVFRFIYDDYMNHEYHTFSCMGDLVVGAWGALLIQRNSVLEKIRNAPAGIVAGLYLTIVIVYFERELLFSIPVVKVVERPAIAILFLLVILEQCYAKNSFFKMKKFRLVSKLGTITYGLYCLQFFGILIATRLTDMMRLNQELWQVLLLDTFFALAITVILAALSYQIIERPFLVFKKKFERVRPERQLIDTETPVA